MVNNHQRRTSLIHKLLQLFDLATAGEGRGIGLLTLSRQVTNHIRTRSTDQFARFSQPGISLAVAKIKQQRQCGSTTAGCRGERWFQINLPTTRIPDEDIKQGRINLAQIVFAGASTTTLGRQQWLFNALRPVCQLRNGRSC